MYVSVINNIFYLLRSAQVDPLHGTLTALNGLLHHQVII